MIGFPEMGGGGGGTNAIMEQAKVRTLGSILRDPTGIKGRREFFNDPQAYLSDEDFKNRGIFPEDRNRRKRGRGAGSPPDGYASGARKESTGFKQFKEKYISGDDSLLNLVALGEHEKAFRNFRI